MRNQPVGFRLLFFVISLLFFLPTRAEGATVVINEIGAAESGSGYEWVEVFNAGADAVQMQNWDFLESDGGLLKPHGLTLKQGADMTLSPGEYAIITQNDVNFLERNPGFVGKIFDSSWGALTNAGEEIGLRDEADILVEQFTYISVNNFSLQRINSLQNDYTAFNWAEHGSGHTAGALNDFSRVNALPVARINAVATAVTGQDVLFDATGSTDDVGIVSYLWDFGDGTTTNTVTTTHAFAVAGTSTIILTVIDTIGAVGMSTLEITVSVPRDTALEKIVINEFLPNPNDGGKEWIEIYNTTTGTISIEGWAIEDAVGRIITLHGTIDSWQFLGTELAAARLNNTGDTITLKHSDGTVMDRVIYGGVSAMVPQKGNSVARRVDGGDTDADNADFAETVTATFGLANIITGIAPPPAQLQPAPQTSNGIGSIPLPTFPVRSVVINELLPDPDENVKEFIELFNNDVYPIDLTDWKIVDGSETRVFLQGTIDTRHYFIIENSALTLNNAGDILRLLDPSGKEIDRVVYGNWDDGSIGDNLPAPGDNISISRRSDGKDTDIDYNDFSLTTVVTKAQGNVIQEVLFKTQNEQNNSHIGISELYPNPPKSDLKDEFIEIYNSGTSTVQLFGWMLSDGSSRFTFSQNALEAGKFLAVKREISGIALGNTSAESVFLFDGNGKLVETVKYFGPVTEGTSYSKQQNGKWVWVTTSTPGVANTVAETTFGPKIVLDFYKDKTTSTTWYFDASDSVGTSTSTLQFVWDFGDGIKGAGDVVEHVYQISGNYHAAVHVIESDMSSSTLFFTVGEENKGGVGGSFDREGIENIEIISILPNPAGSDDAEYITLFNPNAFAVDISNMKLDDSDGGSKPYTIATSTLIAENSSRVFPKSETKLALNNDTDTVRLLYPDGTVLQQVAYAKGKEGQVYMRDAGGVWGWVKDGQAISEINPPKAPARPSGGDPSNAGKVATGVKGVKIVAPMVVGMQNFQSSLRVGARVSVQGVVSVLPGVFGTQYFYIQNASTSTGVQVYMNSKDFPELKVGDVISASGEVSEVSGEKRVKVRSRGDIRVIESGANIEPSRFAIDTVAASMVGSVVSLEGEVTEVKSGSLFIDDGTGEIKVSLKQGANIDSSSFALGDTVRIAGVLRGREDALELTPRFQEDIEEVRAAESEVIPEVKGEKISAQSDLNKYVFVTLIGFGFAAAGLLLRPRLEFAWRNVKAKIKK